MTKTFSIILPIYRVEKYLADCINILLAQTFTDYEIILVDDGSDDNSLKISNEFAKKDSRIKVYKHLKNKGPGAGAARNTGFKHATGKYVLFIDPDDWLNPKTLEIINDKIKKNNRFNTFMFKMLIYHENKNSYIKDGFYPKYLALPEGKYNIDLSDISSLSPHCWNKVYKTSFLKKNNLKFPEGYDFEDMEFFYKVYTLCQKTYVIDEYLYIYRKRENSMVDNCLKNYKKASAIFHITENFYDFLCEKNLFDKYKNYYLKFVATNINEFRKDKKLIKQLYPSIKKCLKHIKFPELYK